MNVERMDEPLESRDNSDDSMYSTSSNISELKVDGTGDAVGVRLKAIDKKDQWVSIKGLVNRINSLADFGTSELSWGKSFEIPTRTGRKGPALGIYSDVINPLDGYSAVIQTPDSMERYSLSGKLIQHRSCLPHAITKVTYGNIGGMGRVIVCGTQTGIVIIYSFAKFKELQTIYTAGIYNQTMRKNSVDTSACPAHAHTTINLDHGEDDAVSESTNLTEEANEESSLLDTTLDPTNLTQNKLDAAADARQNSADSDASSTSDVNLPFDALLLEVNCLCLITSLDDYSKWLAVGNRLGDLLIYEVPSLRLITLVSYPPVVNYIPRNTSYFSFSYIDSDNEYQSISLPNLEGSDFEGNHVSCLTFSKKNKELWVGYGNGSFAVFDEETLLCKKFNEYKNNIHTRTAMPQDDLDKRNNGGQGKDGMRDRVWNVRSGSGPAITEIQFSNIYDIAFVVYDYICVDVWDLREHTLLRSYPSTVLTCGTTLVTSIRLYEFHDRDVSLCLLFIGAMDGSLIFRRIERTQNNEIAWNLLFNLLNPLYDKNDSTLEGETTRSDSSMDFRGAPITCLFPLLSQNMVIAGNSCGGLVSVLNVLEIIK